jgi:hypothetical protein
LETTYGYRRPLDQCDQWSNRRGGLDLASIIGNVASGGVGGAVLLIIVSLIKGTMAKA